MESLEIALNTIGSARGKSGALQGITTATSRRLAALAPLTAEDFSVLNSLKGWTAPAGAVVRGNDRAGDAPCFILSGWSARLSTRRANNQQIISVLLPGDGIGIGAAPWAGEHLPVCTLTDSVLIDATAIQNLIRLRSPRHSGLIEACERASWLEQGYALNQIVRLGRQNAYERTAHFIRELFERLDQAGLVDDDEFYLPVRQQVLANVLGLSGVHFNRIARRMKRDGLVDFPRGAIRVLDPSRLRDMTDAAWIGGFDIK
jgi:hypothetical protein